MVKREALPNFNSKTKNATPTKIGVHAKPHVLHTVYNTFIIVMHKVTFSLLMHYHCPTRSHPLLNEQTLLQQFQSEKI